MGMKPETVKGMGLVSLSEARLLGGEAKNHADGSATLTLRKGFGGFAEDITWTETYTLPAGQPVLTYRTVSRRRARRNAIGVCGLGRRDAWRFRESFARQARLQISGPKGSDSRPAFRQQQLPHPPRLARRAMLGGRGLGAGHRHRSRDDEGCHATLAGHSVWSFGYGGFFARLIDPVQENFPYEFSAGHPLDVGLAFVATSGGADIWNQTRQFFAAVTHDKSSKLASSCEVFLNGEPLMAGEVSAFHDAKRVVRRSRSPSCVTIAWSPKPSWPRQSIRWSSRRVRLVVRRNPSRC